MIVCRTMSIGVLVGRGRAGEDVRVVAAIHLIVGLDTSVSIVTLDNLEQIVDKNLSIWGLALNRIIITADYMQILFTCDALNNTVIVISMVISSVDCGMRMSHKVDIMTVDWQERLYTTEFTVWVDMIMIMIMNMILQFELDCRAKDAEQCYDK